MAGRGLVKSNAPARPHVRFVAAQNEHLQAAGKSTPPTRIHGTTKRHVGQLLRDRTLPHVAGRTVPVARGRPAEGQPRRPHRSEAIVLLRLRSMSAGSVGHAGTARSCGSWNHRLEQIALHCRQGDGARSRSTLSRRRSMPWSVEPRIYWAKSGMWDRRRRAGLRPLEGHRVLAQVDHPGTVEPDAQVRVAIEAACDTAWRSQAFSYRIVKQLLENRASRNRRWSSSRSIRCCDRCRSTVSFFLHRHPRGMRDVR